MWESYLLTVLNSQIEDCDEQYVFYQSVKNASVAILLFSKRKLLPRIKDIYSDKIDIKSLENKLNSARIKGTTIMRFKVDNQTFAIVNSHFESSDAQCSKRADQIFRLCEDTFLQKKLLSQVEATTAIVLVGTFNFNIESATLKEDIATKNIQSLQSADELVLLRKLNRF